MVSRSRWGRARFLALWWCCGCAATAGRSAQPESPDASPVKVAARQDPALQSRAEVVAASSLPTTIHSPLPGDPMDVTVHRLSNGLTVYMSVNREKPRFDAWVGVRAGGRMDPADSTGLAHYLEHMLFKGTDDFGTIDAEREAEHVQRVAELYADLRDSPSLAERDAILAGIDRQTQAMAAFAIPNELDRMYAELGILGVNAFTGAERTVYIGDVPANRFDAWSAVESERFADPVFRLFLPELEAVYEEKNLSLDQPESRVWEAGLAALFPRHPYGTQTILGSVEHLKTPAYGDMVAFFERWYVPNNMAIALAGDIEPERVLTRLEETFGRLEPRPVPPLQPAPISVPDGRVAVEVQAPGTPSVSLSWLLPPRGHPDNVPLEVMDRLMVDGDFGLLNMHLRLTQRVADVGCWLSEYNEAGVFTITAEAKQGQSLDEVEALVLEVVEKLREGAFEPQDVEGVKLQQHIHELSRMEANEGRVAKMMDAFTGRREWADVIADERRYAQVDPADVRRAAQTYLGDDYVVVLRKKGQPDIPKLQKPSISPVSIDASRKSAFAAKVEAIPAAVLEPQWAEEGRHYRRRALDVGPLIAVENHRNDLFALQLEFTRGYAKAPLLCMAMELLEVSGAKDLSPTALQRELYRLGTRVRTSCDAEYTHIDVEGVDRNFEASLELLERWMREPSFTKEDVEKLVVTMQTRRESLLEEDRALTRALDTFAKYGSQSAWLKQPPNRALERASVSALRRLIQGVLDYERRVLYFGPRSADAVATVVDESGRLKDAKPVWIRRYARREAPTVLFVHHPGAKANVRVVLPDATLPEARYALAELWQEYLAGGMSSVVFQEIRESRGLAYSAFAYVATPSLPADETGLIGALSTQADKTSEATATLLQILSEPKIDGPRLVSTKLALDRSYRAQRIDPRALKWWVAHWDDLGLPGDPRPQRWNTVMEATPDQVLSYAQDLADAVPIIAVIGDRDHVDLDALGKLGRVVEVRPKDLYSF